MEVYEKNVSPDCRPGDTGLRAPWRYEPAVGSKQLVHTTYAMVLNVIVRLLVLVVDDAEPRGQEGGSAQPGLGVRRRRLSSRAGLWPAFCDVLLKDAF